MFLLNYVITKELLMCMWRIVPLWLIIRQAIKNKTHLYNNMITLLFIWCICPETRYCIQNERLNFSYEWTIVDHFFFKYLSQRIVEFDELFLLGLIEMYCDNLHTRIQNLPLCSFRFNFGGGCRSAWREITILGMTTSKFIVN